MTQLFIFSFGFTFAIFITRFLPITISSLFEGKFKQYLQLILIQDIIKESLLIFIVCLLMGIVVNL